MTADQPSLFARDDTFLGVCQGLGEDLGIPPNVLRLAITVPLFLFPAQTVAAYFGAGLLVLVTRLVYPVPRAAKAVADAAPAEPAVEAKADLLAADPVPLAA